MARLVMNTVKTNSTITLEFPVVHDKSTSPESTRYARPDFAPGLRTYSVSTADVADNFGWRSFAFPKAERSEVEFTSPVPFRFV